MTLQGKSEIEVVMDPMRCVHDGAATGHGHVKSYELQLVPWSPLAKKRDIQNDSQRQFYYHDYVLLRSEPIGINTIRALGPAKFYLQKKNQTSSGSLELVPDWTKTQLTLDTTVNKKICFEQVVPPV